MKDAGYFRQILRVSCGIVNMAISWLVCLKGICLMHLTEGQSICQIQDPDRDRYLGWGRIQRLFRQQAKPNRSFADQSTGTIGDLRWLYQEQVSYQRSL